MKELLVTLRGIDPSMSFQPLPGPAPTRTKSPDDSRAEYDTVQFKEIFGRALNRQASLGHGKYSREDLADAAREMGIEPHVLDATLDEGEARLRREQIREEIEERRKRNALRKVARTAITFGVINVVLYFFVHWWNVWLVYGAIISIAFGLRDVWFPKERDEAAREERLRDEQRARILERDHAKIEEGVRILLSTTAKRAAAEEEAVDAAAVDAAAEEEAADAAGAGPAAKAPLRAPSSEPNGAPP